MRTGVVGGRSCERNVEPLKFGSVEKMRKNIPGIGYHERMLEVETE